MDNNFLEDKKVIIFDLDGTLIDSIGMWNEMDQILIKETTGKKVELDILQKERESITIQNNVGNVYEAYLKNMIKKYEIPYNFEYIMKRKLKIGDEYITKKIDYKDQADRVLKKLKEKGYILVLATITSKKRIEQYNNENMNLVNKAKFDEIFDLILTTDDVKAKKPNPEVYLKVIEKLNVKPEECIVVEDSIEGVTAAKKANIEVINVVDSYSKENQDKIDKLSKYKFNDFGEFLELLNM